MKNFSSFTIFFLLTLTACWSNTPTVLESVVPVASNIVGYTGLQDETLEFNLTPTNNKKPRPANAVASQNLNTSSLRAQSDFIDVPILKARVIAVRKGKVLRPGQVSVTTELTAIFDWSSDTPLTGSVTLNGHHPPEYTGAWTGSSVPETGQINTTKTNQNAPGFTGNTFKSKQPGRYECVYASWNLASGPFQYVQDEPLKLCKQPVKPDHTVTLTGPRAPTVGFDTAYEIKTSQSILSASVINPVLKIFVPEHTGFKSIRWQTLANLNPFNIQCTPETPSNRIIVCSGSSVQFAKFTLVVKHAQGMAETLRVEHSSDTPDRNPSDNTASLTVLPIVVNTTTDLQVIGTTTSSSSVFVEDQVEQTVTIKNAGPGVAATASIDLARYGADHGSIRPLIPESSSPLTNCVFLSSYQMRCDLPALNAGEEISLRVPWVGQAVTQSGGDRLQAYLVYAQDTDSGNNFKLTTQIAVARNPQKAHALEVQLTAPSSAIEGQTHTTTVTVTNHGPNLATSRSLKFSPAYLVPVATPTGCVNNTSNTDIVCDLTGMPANSSRTFVFSGTALYQQWVWNVNVNASLTESANDLNTFAQSASKYLYVERDPSTLHSLGLTVTGVNAEYFVNDPFSATATVTNYGPANSPPREISIYKPDNGITLNAPAGCNTEYWGFTCPIPSLSVNATWTQTLTGTATRQNRNESLQISLQGHDRDTRNHTGSFYKSINVRGYVGLLSTAFTPAPASSININEAQSFTVVVTNTGQYTSVPDTLRLKIETPDGPQLTGTSFTGLNGCDSILNNPYSRVEFCPIPAIPVGSSWSFTYTLSTPNTVAFRSRADTIGNNDRTYLIGYHEFIAQNGLPLIVAWVASTPLPSSPPGFVLGASHPFAVKVNNPNTTSKNFSLEVKISGTNYSYTLGAPGSCNLTTNPANADPGDDVDRIATCPLTLAAGQTLPVFFSANFPECDYDPPQGGTNCRSTVQISQVQARLIGATSNTLVKTVKVAQ
jgi:hypothetical protein